MRVGVCVGGVVGGECGREWVIVCVCVGGGVWVCGWGGAGVYSVGVGVRVGGCSWV